MAVKWEMEEWGTSFHWKRPQDRHIQPHATSGKSSIVYPLGVSGESVPLCAAPPLPPKQHIALCLSSTTPAIVP